jgi:tetratricopeptide (TPR) repeat protein
MREALTAILDFYRRPLAAPSRAMDECSLLWAAIPAIVLCLAMGFTHPPPRTRTLKFPRATTQPITQPIQYSADDDAPRPPTRAQRSWQERIPAVTPGFQSLLVLAVVFVPSSILIWVLWQSPGGFATILMRDYAPTLLCVLLAWTAAYLPVLLIRIFFPIPQANLLGLAYFTFLAACCLRTVMGIGLGSALVITAGSYLVSFAGLIAFSLFGNVVYYLASPWFLFYFYRQFQSGAAQLGSGLSSRQNLRRSLAVSTLNPRDSDAKYQLGLIYASRRQYTEALNRFTKAAEIDPKDAGARYELGRIALHQQRYQDAFDHFYVAAELDPNHAASAVWRDIGNACFHLDDHANAIAALERYTARREYDPEGLYWLGKALAASGQQERAADAWKKTIEAARTMPSHRRRVMMKWASKANAELKALRVKT